MEPGEYLPANVIPPGDIYFSNNTETPTNGVMKIEGEDTRIRVLALRTRSDVDVMDDGFKWRKYGKKMIKSNPIHPRNYYKCSSRECKVKKKVERDRDDSSYVITTYEGVHNHPTPHNHMSLILPINHWAMHKDSSHSTLYC